MGELTRFFTISRALITSSPIPVIDADSHHISIEGEVTNSLELSIADLQGFEQHSMICALQCAGNRRHAMRTTIKEVQGIDWFDGAVMNCKWTGPRLRDVLSKAGINLENGDQERAQVEFACHQNPSPEEEWFGTSIPLEKAMALESDVIIALKMNDKPLTAKHGYPARIIAPGLAGVRSVKWLDRIKVQLGESLNHYHQRDYRVLPPDVETSEDADQKWSESPALQEMPLNSAIGLPRSGSEIERDENGKVEVRGYALPGYGTGPITRVEVSADDGNSWQDAEIYVGVNQGDRSDLKWAWCLWSTRISIKAGKGQKLLSRATDKKGNTQAAQSEWNLRGIGYCGYGEVNDLHVV
ncbi:hypothetical protein NW762_004137 [Fusarium torreyae]|uniref:Sulfite oxidase n=1 Tax=Fusarium torreyae TaxID=1237075 RepID=A0A9W8S5G4_9HYPO|nr:hypothetical protein NW762_004137 [Fusarium torreyae]